MKDGTSALPGATGTEPRDPAELWTEAMMM